MMDQLTQLGVHFIYYSPDYHIYFMVEDRDIHEFYLDRELNPGLKNHYTKCECVGTQISRFSRNSEESHQNYLQIVKK